MRNFLAKPIRTAVFLLPCLAIGIWAQSTDTLQLVGVGPGNQMGGVYTSPYQVSVDGTTVPLICDDFTTDISIGQTWTAIPTTFAAIQAGTNPGGTPKFTTSEIQSYATIAVLAAELLTLPDNSSYSEQLGEISYALWGVFDTVLLNSTSNPYGSISGTELSAAQGYLAGAQTLVAGATSNGVIDLSKISIGGSSIQGMTIYTPDPKTSSQEFVTVSMDEPTSLATFAVYLALGGCGLVFLKRRVAANSNRV
jgi:hypothetical protein